MKTKGKRDRSRLEKGGFPLGGINLALCENPLPPLDEAIEAARKEIPLSNHYTEPYSKKLKVKISEYIDVPLENIHINAGSELILRQLFSIFGKKVHLISPTYYLFEEIGERKTHTLLDESKDFLYDITELEFSDDTSMVVIVNPNNPTGTQFNIKENTDLIKRHPRTIFLVDEAFIEFGGESAADLIFKYDNIVVTRTFSKAFSLAGCRVGYVISNRQLIDRLNNCNDAYPLARSAQAAAMESLNHIDKIIERVIMLKTMTNDFISSLRKLGIEPYTTNTYFFLVKIPDEDLNADYFAELLAEKNIYARPLYIEGLENKFIRFATSTSDNNVKVIKTIKEIFERF
jgi:histidinol-phosphate aminotransferase